MFNQTSAVLTTPGNVTINSSNTLYTLCQYTVTNVNTNVVLRLEVTADGLNWFNADSAGDTTVTANGTNSFLLRQTPSFKQRLVYVSQSGGTTAVVNVTFVTQ